ncbi:MAG: GntR family transcriptional regulator [Dysgonamonadaceae bacterium]|jgi:DNA-binding transcriptional regulator YhcF (GntR family)|nr:GntR family transcriptional regulator [Dysgonamonadaceae bacterium]
MEFKETQAIFLQIATYVCEQILLGRWSEGDRILSVREMGAALEVNPNTVIRTYEFLQNKEIIFNKRGVGYFINENAEQKIIEFRRKEFLEQELPLIFKNMKLLGMTLEAFDKEYNNYLNSKSNENK